MWPDKINNPNETPIINMAANNKTDDYNDNASENKDDSNDDGKNGGHPMATRGRNAESRPCINECDNTLAKSQ